MTQPATPEERALVGDHFDPKGMVGAFTPLRQRERASNRLTVRSPFH